MDDCKTKWASIRDQLRRTLQKRKSGQAAGKVRKYKYEDILKFLLPYLINVPQVGDENDEDFGFGADSQDISTQEEKVINLDVQKTEEEINLKGINKVTNMPSSPPSINQVSAKKKNCHTLSMHKEDSRS